MNSFSAEMKLLMPAICYHQRAARTAAAATAAAERKTSRQTPAGCRQSASIRTIDKAPLSRSECRIQDIFILFSKK